METSLHRELKQLYAGPAAQLEVRVDSFRIDAVLDGELIEIQHGSLSAIRRKTRQLLESHRVRIVKPIIVLKQLVNRAHAGGPDLKRRASPKRGQLLDLFNELIYFTDVFPHPRLTLEVPLVEIEEYRYPGHGRRRRWGKGDFQIEDQCLAAVQSVHRLRTGADLWRLLACPLPRAFHTGDLAQGLAVPRQLAQRIAYCLREMNIARPIGKQGNALLYQRVRTRRAA